MCKCYILAIFACGIYDYEKQLFRRQMVYIQLPNEEERQLSFYLAMEEYVAFGKNES